LKLAFATRLACAFALAYAAVSALACGDYSTRGAGNAFVGTWVCPSLPEAARTLEISENLDNSLTLSVPPDAGEAPLCPTDAWNFSGSTASMPAGTSCLGGPDGGEVVTVQSFSLTVNGSVLNVSAKETVAGVGTTSSVTLSGNCSKH
jgi:hypothetical protein